MKQKKYKQLTISLPPEYCDWLEKLAKERGTNLSETLRVLIYEAKKELPVIKM